MKTYSSIAIDLAFGIVTSLFFLCWGIELIAGYSHDAQVKLTYAVAMVLIGSVGLLTFYSRPIYLKLFDKNSITILSHMGLRRHTYDLRGQLVSKSLDKSKTYLQLSFSDGRSYRFSKNSFLNLSSAIEKLELSGV